MKALAIDFGKRRKNNSSYITAVFVLVALTCSVFESWAYFVYYSENKAWQSERDADQEKSDVSKNEAPLDEELKAKLKHVTQLIERIDTPWETLFRSVESISENQVAVLSLVSDAEHRELLLTAEAKDLNAMLKYVQLISAAEGLRDVYLSSHQVNIQDALHTIRFTIVANWGAFKIKPQPAVSLHKMSTPAV